MEVLSAEQQKTYTAEKQIAYVRAIVILFGSATFLLSDDPHINRPLCYALMACIWTYGAYVLIAQPYKRYPIFLASWFTYLSDCFFATAWVYGTGSYYSPFYVIYYTSIIAVAFRFDLRTTMLTSLLYSVFYVLLLWFMNQLRDHEIDVTVRCGFLFIIGFLTNFITQETLLQTKEKLLMKKLVEEAAENSKKLEEGASELKALNQKLQLHIDLLKHGEENALMGSFWWKINENTMGYSDNLFRMLDCEPGDFEPSFEKYLDFVDPAEREDTKTLVAKILESRKVPVTTRKMKTKKSVTKYFRTSGKFTGEGVDLLMIGTMQDVTQDVRLNEDLNIKNAELETINNELSSFNYIASHDLQEPVRKIHTFGNLLLQKEKDCLSENGKDYMGRIITSADRMQRLIEAFSNYSRIGSSTMTFVESDLKKLAEAAAEYLSDRIAEHEAVFRYDSLPVITASPFHIQQLFENLFSNALKYRDKDKAPLIVVSCEKVNLKEGDIPISNKSPRAFWKISITDNGIGFDQRYSEKIFEVFQRLHSKEQYPGTGIGLAICKKIALVHKGFISAQSALGKGSRFDVFISAEL